MSQSIPPSNNTSICLQQQQQQQQQDQPSSNQSVQPAPAKPANPPPNTPQPPNHQWQQQQSQQQQCVPLHPHHLPRYPKINTHTQPSTVLTGWQRFASVFREAHPIGRAPRYLKAHDLPGAMYYARRLGRAGTMFVPAMVMFFGWPFAMKAMIDASNGVKSPKAKKAVAHASHKMSRKSSIDSEAWSQRAPA